MRTCSHTTDTRLKSENASTRASSIDGSKGRAYSHHNRIRFSPASGEKSEESRPQPHSRVPQKPARCAHPACRPIPKDLQLCKIHHPQCAESPPRFSSTLGIVALRIGSGTLPLHRASQAQSPCLGAYTLERLFTAIAGSANPLIFFLKAL